MRESVWRVHSAQLPQVLLVFTVAQVTRAREAN